MRSKLGYLDSVSRLQIQCEGRGRAQEPPASSCQSSTDYISPFQFFP